MEKLFAMGNIGLQQMVDEDGLDIFIAYTDDLLKKNLLIEFYQDSTSDDPGDYETETAIFIISCDAERSYSFVLSVEADFIKPLFIYGIVAHAVEFIRTCDKGTVLADLQEICTGFSTSDEMEGLDGKRIYESDKWKFDTAMDLIRESIRKKG
jgi:hypothetical protein